MWPWPFQTEQPQLRNSDVGAHQAKQMVCWFANRVASKYIPAPSEECNRFLLELFRSLKQFICQKKCMNGKNPVPQPRTMLQVSKIFESWPNSPLWIVFTLLALQHLIPKYLITVSEVFVCFRQTHLGSSRKLCTFFSTDGVFAYVQLAKGQISTLPFF